MSFLFCVSNTMLYFCLFCSVFYAVSVLFSVSTTLLYFCLFCPETWSWWLTVPVINLVNDWLTLPSSSHVSPTWLSMTFEHLKDGFVDHKLETTNNEVQCGGSIVPHCASRLLRFVDFKTTNIVNCLHWCSFVDQNLQTLYWKTLSHNWKQFAIPVNTETGDH